MPTLAIVNQEVRVSLAEALGELAMDEEALRKLFGFCQN
jgi:hypothetical protein